MRFLLPLASSLATVLCTPISLTSTAKPEFGRTLAAATRRSSLSTRSEELGGCLKNKVELSYADGEFM